MIYTAAISFLFFISIFLQIAVVQALTLPLAAIPIHLAIGFLLLHRGRIELGAAWFLITPIIATWAGSVPGAWWSYLLIAVIGPILVTRIFARRSLLALMGLSWSLYIIFMITSFSTFALPTTTALWGLLLLTMTLLIISSLEKRFQQISKRFLFIRKI